MAMGVKVEDFFPSVKSNLTKIKWAHAVNSQALLMKTLSSNETHMIEADVNMGKLIGSEEIIPIMAHDINMTSDLSLREFIIKVVANKTKGIKLDFKTAEAYKNGTTLINTEFKNLSIPVWLNADIIPGPINAHIANVDPRTFFEDAKKVPEALLSVGWTTSLVDSPTANATTANYTQVHLDQMKKTLDDAKLMNTSVTFAVRACYAANTIDGLKNLLTQTSNHSSTLTIWSSQGDKVNVTNLNKLIKTVGVAKIYVDVPEDLRKQLDLNGSSGFGASLGLLIASAILTLHRSVL
ncbi:hypothetical protein QAD02_000907 [Eretmocerus hayati]|uniref:Uncharacterized protein n=1 Tax=Eretmocerus hayati TaxID=131215 RepID=A0ACC2NFT9_9HYME|nr:hypothetical protein QAD02_000907 [Eretmocerus hayati]